MLLEQGLYSLRMSDQSGSNRLPRIRPHSTVPICLDFGTNTQKYLDDPLYMGLRQRRIGDEEMIEFMDEFMHEISAAFPKLLIQFEVSTSSSSEIHDIDFNTFLCLLGLLNGSCFHVAREVQE